VRTFVTAAIAAALIVLPTFTIRAQAQDATDHPARPSRSDADTSNPQMQGDIGMRNGDKCWVAASNAPVTNMGYWADCPKPKCLSGIILNPLNQM
jgi:hypothetical protein